MGYSLNQQYDIIAKVNSTVYRRSITVLKQHSCVLERIIHMRHLHLHRHPEDSNGLLQPLLLLLLSQQPSTSVFLTSRVSNNVPHVLLSGGTVGVCRPQAEGHKLNGLSNRFGPTFEPKCILKSLSRISAPP